MQATICRIFILVSLVFATLSAAGCSRGPQAIPTFKVNAEQFGKRAFELHDTNQDGSLDAAELKASPGLAYAAKRADQDGDACLTTDEVVAMIDAWNEKSIGLLTLRCNVKHRRRPLIGATVRLEPEGFLDGEIETAIGVTDEFGDAFLSIPKDKRPIADSPPGVQLGLYRVVISKMKNGKETLHAKYNSATTLGQEVSFDDPGVLNGIYYVIK